MSTKENNCADYVDLGQHAHDEVGDEPMDVSVDEETLNTHEDRETVAAAEPNDKGVSILELRQGFNPWGPPPLPPVHPSLSHTVLYKLPWRPGKIPKPYPPTPCDCWDQEHVRMPNSSESLYPVQETEDEKGLRLRWELVQEALLRTILSSHQLEAAVLSYNSRYNEKWNFRALHTLCNEVLEKEETHEFFKTVLPGMISLALQLPENITGPIPLLRKHKCHTISLSQLQIASLLANAFFCTFPRRNSTKRGSEYAAYPDINFNRLFQSGDSSESCTVIEKLKCVLNYFRRLSSAEPHGTVTFCRRYIPTGSCPNWSSSTKPLPKMHITSSGFIEDQGCGMLQVDFANKFIGGGVLGWGCVQEEIRFVICPELIVSRLFTECLDSTEALIIVGCERFNAYSGYGQTFEWVGDFQDPAPVDSAGRKHCSIVAMDALYFNNPSTQYSVTNLLREVNKAYVGFRETEDTDGNPLAPVATGNWGCGAFRGDAHLKALLQLIAAGETGRGLVYFTFGDRNLRDRIYEMYKFLWDNNVTVGQLWDLLCQYSRKLSYSRNELDLYEFLYSAIQKGREKKAASDLSSAPILKPTFTEKKKPSSTQSMENTSSSHLKSLPDAGLTPEDLDSLIEEFDSDIEEVEKTVKEDDRKLNTAATSTSCLALIEEGLYTGKERKESSSAHKRASNAKSNVMTPTKCAVDDSGVKCSPNINTASEEAQETQSSASVDQNKTVSEIEASFPKTPVEQPSTPTDSKPSASSKKSSSVKRSGGPKCRKISDFYSPA